MKIPFSKFLLALKLFELEALRACKELGVAYNTIHNIFMLIRIYKETSEVLQGEVEADESYFGGKGREGEEQKGRYLFLV